MSPSTATCPQATTSPSRLITWATNGTGEWTSRCPWARRCASEEPRNAPTVCAKASCPIGVSCSPRGNGLGAPGGRIGAHHHARVVELPHPEPLERRVQPGRLAERRDPQQHGKPRFVEDMLAEPELQPELQAAGRHGVHAARALGLARGKTNEPAVDQALLGRGAGIQSRVLDAGKKVVIQA
jgi:hypothetical protein